jgi:hypothetical protein
MVTTLEETTTYDQYINLMRGIINKRSGLKSASYFAVSGGSTKPIKKEDIFPIVYYPEVYPKYIINQFPLSSKLDYILIVVSTESGEELVYTKEIGEERKDIYMDKYREKLPESIIIKYSVFGRKFKLEETRSYQEFSSKALLIDPNKHVEKNIKIMKKSLLDIIEAPTLLSLPLILLKPAYFPPIFYISKPYHQYHPYVLVKRVGVMMGYDTNLMVPVKTTRNLLSALLITSIIKSPTVEPYLLNLPWDFEFNKRNIRYINVEIEWDEMRYKLKKVLDAFSHVITETKFVPVDLEYYQMVPLNYNKKGSIVFIDIAPGLDVALSVRGLKRLYLTYLYELLFGLLSPNLLRKCIKEDNRVICNSGIDNGNIINIDVIKDFLGDDIYRVMMGKKGFYFTTQEIERIEKLSRYRKDELNLDEKLKTIDSIPKDSFTKIKEILLKTHEIYLEYIKY